MKEKKMQSPPETTFVSFVAARETEHIIEEKTPMLLLSHKKEGKKRGWT
jgi:hypothetical protein